MWWKIVAGVGTIIALITGLLAIDGRYARCIDLERAVKDHDRIEKKTVEILDDFRKELNRNFQIQRLEALNDTFYKQKALVKLYPSDVDLKDDLTKIEQERSKIKELIK
jgi:hypothetical protein